MEVVTGALGILLPKLAELLKEEYGLRTGVKEKIKSLSTELEMVQAVLKEVSDVPWDQLDEPIRLWVRNLREASYDMEDVVDSFLVRVDGTKTTDPHMLERQRKKVGFRKKVGKLCKKIEGFLACRDISSQIQDITKKLEELAVMRSKYKLDSDITKSAAATTIDPRLPNLYKMGKELVGIDGPRDELISKLSVKGDIDGSDEETKVFSVVGFGGLGKTTLAKVVYDQLKPHFECAAFVPVGQKPDVKKVLRDILIDLNKGKCMNLDIFVLDEKQLMDELKDFVKEKRCFIVIDDIWDEEHWKLIRCALQESNCSRVVITTRIFEVARHANEVYKLKKLSPENSEKLLRARIDDGDGKYIDGPSSKACDKILKKCDGVPLAIITIASLLASKPEQYWGDVYNSIGFGQEDNDDVDNTRRILSFSYYDLPSHLKPCLLYLSVFPEDHVIYKNSLIWMWVAEGFIQKEQEAREGLFELGEGYFNELINRNMILPMEEEHQRFVNMKREDQGYVDRCRVHDMVLDLINKLSREQNFVTVLDGDEHQRLPGSVPRRLSLQHVSQDNGASQLANINVKKVRSLIVSEGELGSACPHIPFLCVLDLGNCEGPADIKKGMLDHLESLPHLRYLRLPYITKLLPRHVRYLKCLQILDLWECYDMDELPEEVGLLTRLVCLRVWWRTRVPAGVISKLTSLQQLSKRPAVGIDVMQFIKELGMLRELRVLWTVFDVTSESMERALLESLGNMHNIRKVQIYGTSSPDNNGGTRHAGFISSRHLQHLDFHCIVFSGVPASLAPNLCYLRMKVRDVKERDMEALARLSELCHLDLQVCSPDAELICIKIPIGARYFRRLRILKITGSSIWFDLHASQCCSSSSSSRIASNIMPSLESLEFAVNARSRKDATRLGYDDKLLGFENLGTTSLQRVTVEVECAGACISEVVEVWITLVHACRVHSKRPTLKIQWKNKATSPYKACMDMNGTYPSIIKAWKLANVTDSKHIGALRMPDPASSSSKVIRVQYTNDGTTLLALCSHSVHMLWESERSDRSPLGNATTYVPLQLRQPENCTVMTNDTTYVNPVEATCCMAVSKNGSYSISASGGKVSLFNINSGKIMTSFMAPPPAATFLAFYPQDNNIIAIGMENSSIQIYNVRIDEVKAVLMGHAEKITGLAFSQSMDVLVSSSADAQLCVWSIDGWEKKESRYIQPPSNRSGALVGDTTLQFHPDQTHLLVVHESQLGIYDGKLECMCSWFPRDTTLPAPVSSAVYSSDGLLVYTGLKRNLLCYDAGLHFLPIYHLQFLAVMQLSIPWPSLRIPGSLTS